MIVSVRGLKTCCLHSGKYRERLVRISAMCEKLGLRCSFFPADTKAYSHQRNVAYDLTKLISTAICENEYPFLLLEDDATLIDSIPQFVDIPENSDLIYWGSNEQSGPPTINDWLKLEDYSPTMYRIYNSQSGHAIVFPARRSADLFRSILLETLITDEYHDVLLPNASPNQLFLTPKDGPYFYQSDGKNEQITKIKWSRIRSVWMR